MLSTQFVKTGIFQTTQRPGFSYEPCKLELQADGSKLKTCSQGRRCLKVFTEPQGYINKRSQLPCDPRQYPSLCDTIDLSEIYGPAGTGNLESECFLEGSRSRSSEPCTEDFGLDLDPQAQVFEACVFVRALGASPPSVPTGSPTTSKITLEGPYSSAPDFSACLNIRSNNNARMTALEFDVTPQRESIDGVVMLADSSVIVPRRWKDFGMLVRMNSNGYFDVRNGDRYMYTSEDPVGYEAGDTYHVRMVVVFGGESRYNVSVSTSNDEETQIADNFLFRHDSLPMNDVGKMCLRSTNGNDHFRLSNLIIFASF